MNRSSITGLEIRVDTRPGMCVGVGGGGYYPIPGDYTKQAFLFAFPQVSKLAKEREYTRTLIFRKTIVKKKRRRK